MKKMNITVPFEDEKLKALRLFAAKKDVDIEAELEDTAQKLYEKYVPKDAREYIDLVVTEAGAIAKPKPARAALVKKPDFPTQPSKADAKPETQLNGSFAASGKDI